MVTPKKWAQCKAVTTGHAPAEPPAVSVHADALLDAWAVALGIPSHIRTYAQYVAEVGEPVDCAACTFSNPATRQFCSFCCGTPQELNEDGKTLP